MGKDAVFKKIIIPVLALIFTVVAEWFLSDVLENQSLVSPHEIVNDYLGKDGDESDEGSSSSTTEQPYGFAKVTAVSANLRAGAGTDNPVVTTANKDVLLTMTGNDVLVGDATWYEIIVPGTDGTLAWISGKICEVELNEAPAPLIGEFMPDKKEEDDNNGLVVDTSSMYEIYIGRISQYSLEKLCLDYNTAKRASLNCVKNRLSNKEISAIFPDALKTTNWNSSYSGASYWIRKISHIIIFVVTVLILFFIGVDLNTKGGFKKFLSILIFALIAFAGFSFVKDNSQYKYVVSKQYELYETESDGPEYTFSYYDDNEIYNTTVDVTSNQLIFFDQNFDDKYLYVIKKKPKNIWYYLTELKPKERTIYLVY